MDNIILILFLLYNLLLLPLSYCCYKMYRHITYTVPPSTTMPSTTPPLTVPTPNSIPIDNKEWIKKLLKSIIDCVNCGSCVNGSGGGNGSGCGNGGGNCGNCGSCVNGGGNGSGCGNGGGSCDSCGNCGGCGNEDYIDTNEYRELIIVYMQVIKTCNSIYKKFINMH